MPADSPNIAVIVLNWNRKADTLRCLASLAEADYPQLTVIVVDNASSDGSVSAIAAAFPDVILVENQSNLGFAAGNNVGIELALRAGFDAILLLNNDTVVAANSISVMANHLHCHPNVGVVAPAICYLQAPQRIWSAGGSIDWKQGTVSTDRLDEHVDALPVDPYATEHVSGCCMLVRSDAVQLAGMLDPRFFMYFEETEWCVRIARAGYDIHVTPAARIFHDIAPDQHLGSPAVAYYMTRNQLLFLRATRAPVSAWLRTVYRQVRTLLALCLKPASPERARGRVPMARALRDFAFGRFGEAQAR